MEKTKYTYAENPSIPRRAKALRAARELRGLSRKQAAERLSWSHQAIERIENGRWKISEQKLNLILKAFALDVQEFKEIEGNPQFYLAEAIEKKRTQGSKTEAKPRRNFYKKLSKEARIIRIMREQKGISQTQAGRLCGYARCTFGQLENGRIELPPKRIVHIVSSIGCELSEFEKLMKADEFPQEAISRCIEKLKLLPMQKLKSIELILESM